GGSLFLLGYMFTDGCHEWVLGRIQQEFTSMPESERRDSAWAGRFLMWAEFKGYVCGDYKAGASMYKEFCGLPKDYNTRAWDYVASQKFQKNETHNSLLEKLSPNGLPGGGPTHPDAPDAFYEYLNLIEPHEAGATTGREAKVYWLIFYEWHRQHTPSKLP